MLDEYDMHSSAKSCYHFQIADASGASVVVEYIGDEMALVRPGDATTAGAAAEDRAYQVATNFLLTPGEYDFGHGQDRYETLMERLAATSGVMTEDEAMESLAAVAQDKHENARGEESWTQWSVVYNLDELTASVVAGMGYDEPTHEFSLGA